MIGVLAGVTIVCAVGAVVLAIFSAIFSSAAGNYRAGNLNAWSCRVFKATQKVVERLSQPRRGCP